METSDGWKENSLGYWVVLHKSFVTEDMLVIHEAVLYISLHCLALHCRPNIFVTHRLSYPMLIGSVSKSLLAGFIDQN